MKKLIFLAVSIFSLHAYGSIYYQEIPNTYVDSSLPPTNDNSVINGVMVPQYWINSDTRQIYMTMSQDDTNMIWGEVVYAVNLKRILQEDGWELNTQHAYTSQSVSFGTGRTPSITNDTQVVATVNMTDTILQSSVVAAQEDCGSGYSEIGRVSTTLGVVQDQDEILSFNVSANCAYKLVSSGTGTNSIISVKEKSY